MSVYPFPVGLVTPPAPPAEEGPPRADHSLWLDALRSGALWQDVARTTPAASDYDPVASWYDPTANIAAEQTTFSAQPAVLAGGLEYDDFDDWLLLSSAVTIGTVFVVASFASPGDQESYLLGGNSPATTVLWGYDNDANGMRLISGGGSYIAGLKRTEVRGAAHIFTLRISAGLAVDLRIDGVPQGTTMVGAPFAPNVVGAFRSGGGNIARTFGGILSCVLIYPDEFSTTDTEAAESWLGARFGVSL